MTDLLVAVGEQRTVAGADLGARGGAATAFELETFLPYRLSVLSSLANQALAAVHAPHGLNKTEWIVLATIAARPQTTAKDIGASFHMQKAKISRTVAALLEDHLISRRPSPQDHRLALLELTPKGQRLYEQCAPALADAARRLEEALAPPERELMLRCLLKLADAARLTIAAQPAHAARPAADAAAEHASGAPQP